MSRTPQRGADQREQDDSSSPGRGSGVGRFAGQKRPLQRCRESQVALVRCREYRVVDDQNILVMFDEWIYSESG